MTTLEAIALAALLLVALGCVAFPVASVLVARRLQREALAQTFAEWKPPVTVVLPCRGEQQGFEENLRAIAAQAYPDFELLVAVDSADDPSADAFRRVAPPRARLVVVDRDGADAPEFRSGKARAQATAVRRARPASRAIVFVDADVRPARDWLSRMVEPLSDPAVGAVTAYRWYVSERHGFWSRLRAQWNGTGLDAMLLSRYRFCWGGSMALRRETYELARVEDAMREAIAEDVALTRAVERLGLLVAFAPRACSVNVEDTDRGGCLEWCVRQTALTRESMPRLWRFAAAVYGASVALFVLGVAAAAAGFARADPTLALAGAAMTIPVLSNPLRTRMRWRFFRELLPGHRPLLDAERDSAATSLFQPFLMLYVLHRSRRVRAIAWRGRTYALRPPRRVAPVAR
ncbi:MAG TPA: glycosyltransferase family 2 protein [Candidatus Thermoplasmatota archaeon]|nr:glycosyltransferase family 2 protein [Candidatus Thermoplasmatota archaeon]